MPRLFGSRVSLRQEYARLKARRDDSGAPLYRSALEHLAARGGGFAARQRLNVSQQRSNVSRQGTTVSVSLGAIGAGSTASLPGTPVLAHTHDEQFPCSRRCAILAVRSSGSMLATIFKATPSPRSIGGFCGRMRPASASFDFGGFVAPTAGEGSRSERPQEIKVERSRFLSSMESGRTFLIEITHSSGRSLARGPPLAESSPARAADVGATIDGNGPATGRTCFARVARLVDAPFCFVLPNGLSRAGCGPARETSVFPRLRELGDGGARGIEPLTLPCQGSALPLS